MPEDMEQDVTIVAPASDLKRGDQAPNFHLRDQNGNGWSLSDFEDHFLVLFFEDAADGERTRRLVNAFEAEHDRFKRLDAKVVGISPQDEDALNALAAEERLRYNLLADPELEAARLFGTLERDLGQPRPRSYLIGPDGAILKAYDVADDPKDLTAQLLADLKGYVREKRA